MLSSVDVNPMTHSLTHSLNSQILGMWRWSTDAHGPPPGFLSEVSYGLNGGFLKGGYHHSWMVYKENPTKIDDLGVHPFQETSKSPTFRGEHLDFVALISIIIIIVVGSISVIVA